MAEKPIYIAEKSELKRHEEPFRKIVEAHGRMLYAHIRSMVLNHDDTDDVLQNTFIKAWQNLDGFRNEASLSTWLFRIATNEALQHLRRQKLKNLFHISQKRDMEPMQDGNDINDGDAIRLQLEKAMCTLSVQQRTVFGMKYFNNMKYNEMSKILNLREGTLKAVYHNAVKKIEKYIIENA
jgi:RNA polymerase sigma-70 factor, ECF subfamily